MDWEQEKKRIEETANTLRTRLDMARAQVRALEEELYRLEGEYRLVCRLEELANKAKPSSGNSKASA